MRRLWFRAGQEQVLQTWGEQQGGFDSRHNFQMFLFPILWPSSNAWNLRRVEHFSDQSSMSVQLSKNSKSACDLIPNKIKRSFILIYWQTWFLSQSTRRTWLHWPDWISSKKEPDSEGERSCPQVTSSECALTRGIDLHFAFCSVTECTLIFPTSPFLPLQCMPPHLRLFPQDMQIEAPCRWLGEGPGQHTCVPEQHNEQSACTVWVVDLKETKWCCVASTCKTPSAKSHKQYLQLHTFNCWFFHIYAGMRESSKGEVQGTDTWCNPVCIVKNQHHGGLRVPNFTPQRHPQAGTHVSSCACSYAQQRTVYANNSLCLFCCRYSLQNLALAPDRQGGTIDQDMSRSKLRKRGSQPHAMFWFWWSQLLSWVSSAKKSVQAFQIQKFYSIDLHADLPTSWPYVAHSPPTCPRFSIVHSRFDALKSR